MQPFPLPTHLVLGTIAHIAGGKHTHLWSGGPWQTWRARFSFSSHQGILSTSLISLFARRTSHAPQFSFCISIISLAKLLA